MNSKIADERRHDTAVRALINENGNIRENLFKALRYVDELEAEVIGLRQEVAYYRNSVWACPDCGKEVKLSDFVK